MAMTLSAVMNLTGNFVSQIQKNAQAMQVMAQQAAQTGNAIKNSIPDNIGQKFAAGLNQARDAAGAAGVASLGFLKSSVDAAAKAEKTNADLTQTIKSTGGAAGMTASEVSKMASEMSKTNLASAGMIKEGDNMLLTFTNIGKDVLPMATQSMVDLAQKMGGAPKDSAIQLGKALNDPTTGLTALTRVGVTFTDQQKDQIKTMQATGDMAGAQKVILNELNKEFGGQGAAALNTYDGQMQKFTQTIGGIKSAIGSVLLPYLTQIAQKLNSGAQAVSGFAQEHKTLIAIVLSITGVLGSLIGGLGLFSKIFSLLGPAVTAIGGLIGGLTAPIILVIAAIAGLVYAYTQNFGGIKDTIDSFIQPIVSAFQHAIDAFKNTGSAITAISALIGSLFGDDAADQVAIVLNNIEDVVMSLIDTVKANMPQIKSVFQDVFLAIGNIFNNIIKPVFIVLMQIIAQVVGFVVQHWPEIQKVMQTVFNAIVGIWNSVLKPVLIFIIAAISQVVGWVQSNWPLISQTISTVMNAVWSVISSILSSIKAFWNTWGQTIMDYVSMCWNNIKIIIETVIHVVEDIIKAVMQAINGDWSGAWNSICDAVGSIFTGAIDIIQNVINGIGNIFKDIATVAVNWGKDMIQGIIDGIKGAIGGVEDAVKNVADKIRAFLHFSVPDEGPLTDYETWMPDFMKGMSNGIKVNTHLVTDPIKDIAVGIKTNTLNGLSGGVPQIKAQPTTNNNKDNNPKLIQIAKLADQIIVREDADIDKIATALANKLIQTELGIP
jgi:phage-related protein